MIIIMSLLSNDKVCPKSLSRCGFEDGVNVCFRKFLTVKLCLVSCNPNRLSEDSYRCQSVVIICSIFTFSYRGSIVIVQKIEIEIFTNLDVLHLPESEKHGFAILSVCLCVCVCVSVCL